MYVCTFLKIRSWTPKLSLRSDSYYYYHTNIIIMIGVREKKMEDDDDDVLQKKEEDELFESLQYAVGSICQMVDDSNDDGVVVGMSWNAIRTLTELVYNYTTNIMSQDLVSFSEHANRKTITLDDVKLMARKNPANLYNQLQELNRYDTTTETMMKQKKKQHSKLPSPTTTTTTMTLTQIRDTKLQNMDSSSSDDDDDDAFGMKQTIENRIQPKKFSIFSNTTTSSSSSSSSDEDDTEPDLQQPSQKRSKHTIDMNENESSNLPTTTVEESFSDQSVIDLSG